MATITEIFAKARFLVSATSKTLPDDILLADVNQAGDETIAWYIANNKRLRVDDLNNTNLPIGTFDLTHAKQDYAFDGTILSMERIEVLGTDGLMHRVDLIDERDIPGSLTEYKKTPGLPDEYARRANSIFFYCPPSSTQVVCGAGTKGGKIYYQRGFKKFELADIGGTKEPGFLSHHFILAFKAALPYASLYKKDRVSYIASEIVRMQTEMLALSSMAINDKPSRMVSGKQNNK